MNKQTKKQNPENLLPLFFHLSTDTFLCSILHQNSFLESLFLSPSSYCQLSSACVPSIPLKRRLSMTSQLMNPVIHSQLTSNFLNNIWQRWSFISSGNSFSSWLPGLHSLGFLFDLWPHFLSQCGNSLFNHQLKFWLKVQSLVFSLSTLFYLQ